MIFYDYVRDLNTSQADFQLNSVLGDHAPSNTTIFNWFAEFWREESHFLVKSYWTSGTVFTPENPIRMKILIWTFINKYTKNALKTSFGG